MLISPSNGCPFKQPQVSEKKMVADEPTPLYATSAGTIQMNLKRKRKEEQVDNLWKHQKK